MRIMGDEMLQMDDLGKNSEMPEEDAHTVCHGIDDFAATSADGVSPPTDVQTSPGNDLNRAEMDYLMMDDDVFEVPTVLGFLESIAGALSIFCKDENEVEEVSEAKPEPARASLIDKMPKIRDVRMSFPYSGEVPKDYSLAANRRRNRRFSAAKRMGWDDAVNLVNALEAHPQLSYTFKDMNSKRIFRRKFIEAIANTAVPSKRRFYSRIPLVARHTHLIEGGYFHVSLKYVLRNDGATAYQNDMLKHWFERALIVDCPKQLRKRSAFQNENPAYLMAGSDMPFSLLGNYRRVEVTDNDEGIERAVEMPLLVIPGHPENDLTTGWAKAFAKER